MAKIRWEVVSWQHGDTGARTAFSISTVKDVKGLTLNHELIVFRVNSPHDIAIQQKRAEDYCFYLNLLEERNEELTITSAVAQRLLKEESK